MRIIDDVREEHHSLVTVALKAAIHDSGLSLRELARRSGVSQASLSLFLTGKRSVNLRAVDALAKTLNLRLQRNQEENE